MEKLLEEVSFTASDRAGEQLVIDPDYVRAKVGHLLEGADLSQFHPVTADRAMTAEPLRARYPNVKGTSRSAARPGPVPSGRPGRPLRHHPAASRLAG